MLRTCREREVRVDIEVKKALDQSNTIAERTVSQTQALKTISKILDVSAGPAFIKIIYMFRFQELTQKRQVWCFAELIPLWGVSSSRKSSSCWRTQWLTQWWRSCAIMRPATWLRARNCWRRYKPLRSGSEVGMGRWTVGWCTASKLQVAICLKLLAGLTKGSMLLVEPPCYKTSRRRSRIKSNERSQEI